MNSLQNMKLHIRNFFSWWITGLAYLIPVSLRRAISPPTDYIIIECNDEKVTFMHCQDDSLGKLDERSFLITGDETERTATLNWLKDRLSDNIKLILLVPSNKVLQKTISLPLATEANLRQVLGFEIDRRTPFSVDQVYFDYIFEKKDAEKNQLQVQFFVTPREYIDQILKMLNSWEVKPSAISIKDNIIKLNLLPAEQQSANYNHKTNRTTIILTVVACCLFMAALYIPLLKQKHVLNKLEKEVSESRAIAVKAQVLKKKKNNAIEKSLFLILKRNDYTPIIQIVDELTQLIPDDTWLTRFALTKGEIQLQGESDTASSMIHIVESSEYFTDAHFRSPVTRNEATKKDRFNVSAKLIQH